MSAELISILAFAVLFAVFGALRLRPGCSSDPSSCARCKGWCTKQEQDRPDPTPRVHH